MGDHNDTVREHLAHLPRTLVYRILERRESPKVDSDGIEVALCPIEFILVLAMDQSDEDRVIAERGWNPIYISHVVPNMEFHIKYNPPTT
jgi:hypothetical protein